jgi:hypothetical protein
MISRFPELSFSESPMHTIDTQERLCYDARFVKIKMRLRGNCTLKFTINEISFKSGYVWNYHVQE